MKLMTFVRLCTLACAMPTSAFAGTLKVCNYLPEPINVAYAYSDHKVGPVTKGWSTLSSGQCTNSLFRGHGSNFYIYAGYNNGNAVLKSDAPGSTWLCVTLKAFSDDFRKHVRSGNLDCEADNMLKRQFLKLSYPGDKEAVFNFRPSAQPPSQPQPSQQPPGPMVKAAPQGQSAPQGLPQTQPNAPANPPLPSGPAPNAPSACQLFPNLC